MTSNGVPAPLEYHDLSLSLEKGLPTLEDCAGVLAAAGINIDAINYHALHQQTSCHLLVEDGAAALNVLRAAGANHIDCRPVLVYTLPNQPGTLARYARALIANDVAIDFIYQATAKGVVVAAPDLEAVRAAWRNNEAS
jgi:hypothetical protein